MRRDLRAPDLAPAPAGGEAPADPAEALVAAYVDGVAELSAAERRAVEARLAADGALRDEAAATRALLGQLRELPPEGEAPDWGALERAIASAVGPRAPRPWWRRAGLRWLAPAAELAVATAAAVLVLRAPAAEEAEEPSGAELAQRPAPVDAEPAARDTADAPPRGETVALWLDGAPVEVELDPEVRPEALLALPWEPAPDAVSALDALDGLAGSDLAWVDELDGEALELAAEALADPSLAPAAPERKPS